MTAGSATSAAAVSSRREARVSVAGYALLLGFSLSTFGLVLGTDRIALLGEAVAIAAAIRCLARASRPFPPWTIACIAVFGLLFALDLIDAMGSNFAGWYPLLLGMRKALPIWLFLAAGSVWPAEERSEVLRRLVALLAVAGVVSLFIHRFLPAREQAINRAAGTYTALFDNTSRLQGVFAGPFHAALVGLALVIVALCLTRVLSTRQRLVCGAIGVVVLLQADVRSAWVAVLAATLALGIFTVESSGRRSLAFCLAATGALAVVGLNARIFSLLHNGAIDSLSHWSSDSRFLNRVQDWQLARHLAAERPVTGWGAGSAGDTLDRYFVDLTHVTPHNMLLKYAVENGYIGAFTVAVLIVGLLWRLWQQRTRSRLAVFGLSLTVAFLVFATTGTGVDAVPVSWIVFTMIGLCSQTGFGRADAVGAAATESNS